MTRSWLGRAALALAAFVMSEPAYAQQLEETRAPEGINEGADTHLFRPAIDSKGFFSTNGTDVLGKNDFSFGLVLDYGNNLLRTSNSNDPEGCTEQGCTPTSAGHGVPALVESSFQGTFNFSYGIANVAVVGITAPVILMSGDPAYNIGPDANRYSSQTLDSQKIANLALHGKVRFTRVDKGIGLGAAVQVGIPVAGAPQDLGADPGAWFWPQLIIENRFGATGRFRIGANVGYRGHTGDNARFDTDGFGNNQLEEGILEYGNLATYQGGIAWRALDSLDLVAESYGTMLVGTDSDSGQTFSNEFVGGLKLFIEEKSFLMMGGGSRAVTTGFEAADLRLILGFVFEPSIGDRDGDGLKDDEDQCPDDPEDFDNFKDEDGCPDPDNDNDGILDIDDRCPNVPEDFDNDEDEDGCPEGEDGDRDGDGILDSKDKCPDDPEDRDGFEDKDGCPDPDNDKDGILDKDDKCPFDPEDKDNFEDDDGCPEPDNDRDGILDKQDKCPNDPETYNGFDDKDGCPDKGKVIIEGSNILILEKVNFETGSAKILPSSFPIIEAVATTLSHHPEFLVVEIAGHADERSSDDYNQKLTKDRARSVVEAIADRGVERKRLVSQGYGEYCPLDEGHNAGAWEKNRRVEFKVVKTEDGSTGVERGCDAARAKGVMPPPVP